MDKLKECPFCGELPTLYSDKKDVCCSNIDCPLFELSFLEEIWNTRFGQPQTHDFTPSEYLRLVEWMKDPKREPAITAFTAGNCRQAARAFEEYLKSQLAIRLPEKAVAQFLRQCVKDSMPTVEEIENIIWQYAENYKEIANALRASMEGK